MKGFGIKTYDKLYYNCVVPILEYGSSLRGFKTYKCLGNIYNRSMRYYFGVHRFAPVTALNGDTGWLPCVYWQWLSIIRFWKRLSMTEENRLIKTVFNLGYNICENNWCSELKRILCSIDLTEYYNNKLVINMNLAELILNRTMGRSVQQVFSNHQRWELISCIKIVLPQTITSNWTYVKTSALFYLS